jgi:hypothetical protein
MAHYTKKDTCSHETTQTLDAPVKVDNARTFGYRKRVADVHAHVSVFHLEQILIHSIR